MSRTTWAYRRHNCSGRANAPQSKLAFFPITAKKRLPETTWLYNRQTVEAPALGQAGPLPKPWPLVEAAKPSNLARFDQTRAAESATYRPPTVQLGRCRLFATSCLGRSSIAMHGTATPPVRPKPAPKRATLLRLNLRRMRDTIRDRFQRDCEEHPFGGRQSISSGVSGQRHLCDQQAETEESQDPAESTEKPTARLAKIGHRRAGVHRRMVRTAGLRSGVL